MSVSRICQMRVAMMSFSLLSCALFANAERLPTEAAAFVEMVPSGHMISKRGPTGPTGPPLALVEMISRPSDDPPAETAAATTETAATNTAVTNSGTGTAVKPAESAVDENAIEVKATKPEFDIAKEGSELKKLPGLFKDMQVKFKNAADKVWKGGDEKKADNFIQKTGLDWMNNVQTFRHTAGEMRKHAEDVYDDIVKSHTVAAKKQMRTFKEEMAKLKPVHDEHARMAEEAKKVDTSGTPETKPEKEESGAATITEEVGKEKTETPPKTDAEKLQEAHDACAAVVDVECRSDKKFRQKRTNYEVPDNYKCVKMYTCTKKRGEEETPSEWKGPFKQMSDCAHVGRPAEKVCAAQECSEEEVKKGHCENKE